MRPTHGSFHCFGCAEGGGRDRLRDEDRARRVRRGGRAAGRPDRVPAHLHRRRHVGAARPRHPLAPAGGEQEGRRVLRRRAAHARGRAARSEFLTSRGFDAAAAQQFGCGFAPAGWDALTKHLLGAGFTLDELIKAGLSKEGRRGPIDRFHRRLLWPIRDLGGDVVGFGGRRIFDDDPIEAKYLNTPETPVYRKTHVLFGLDLAKREIAKRRQVVVVEGYTDVMAMHLAGVPTAVASCGTAFGAEHVSVLRRLMGDDSFDRGEVIYTFDGDAAGQAAALKAFDGDQNFAAQTFVCVAPDGQDPCELRLASGDTAVRDLVARREPLFEFAIRSILRDHDLDTAEGRVAALQRCVPLVARIKREDLRDEYARRLAGWTSWDDIAMVVRRVRESAGAPAERPRGARPAPAPPARDDPRLHRQREALKAALQVPAIAGPSLRRAARAGLHAPVVRAGAPCGAGRGRRVRRPRGARLAGRGGRRVRQGGPRAGQRAGRRAAGAAQKESAQKNTDEVRYVASIVSGVRLAMVDEQIAEIKSRLQRTNPVDDADTYLELFGDLVPLEQYRIALREKAMGRSR